MALPPPHPQWVSGSLEERRNSRDLGIGSGVLVRQSQAMGPKENKDGDSCLLLMLS